MAQRPQVEDTHPTHDAFKRHVAHITNLAKIGSFLNDNLHDRGVISLRNKIAQELRVFHTFPRSCGQAECDAKELLRLAALAKDLGCQHDDKEDGEACIFRTLHLVIGHRVKAMSLLYDPQPCSTDGED